MATSSLLHSDCQEAQHICTHLKMEKLLSENQKHHRIYSSLEVLPHPVCLLQKVRTRNKDINVADFLQQ